MKQNQFKYKKIIGLVVSLAAMVLTVAVVWAQSIEQVTINYIEASAVPEKFANQVRVYVTVSDADENPILGLSERDFEALEDGRKVALDRVSQTTDPMAVVLAIDTSGSMQARDKSGQTSMDAAKKAAVDFISMLAQDDQVAIFSFNNEPILQMDFSVDHRAAIKAVNSLFAKTNAYTCLYDTAFEAVKKAAEIPKGRRAIILLTDGKDEKRGGKCSTHSVNDVIDAATTKTIRVPIYTIGAGPKVDAQELGRISSLTGGRNLLAASLAELPGFYETIANQLKNQYLVTYNTRCPSGEHSLVIKARYEGSRGQDERRFWSPPLPVMRPPTVSFISPSSSDQIRDIVTVRVSITPKETVVKTRYYVDASLKKEHTTAPFDTFKWDTSGLPGGLHILRVEAVDISGQFGCAEMTLNVIAPAPPLAPTPAPAVEEAEEAKPTPVPVVKKAKEIETRPAPVVKKAKEIKAVPAPVVKQAKGILPVLVWAGAIVLLLALVGAGFVWWYLNMQKRKEDKVHTEVEPIKPEDLKKALMDKRDETRLIDVKEELAHRAMLKVVKSLELEPGKTFEIVGTSKLGRSDRNEVYIPDQPVSRTHAEIYFDGKAFYLRDLGSKFGTKVGGRSVSSSRTKLYDGAQIQLASKTILEFHAIGLEAKPEVDDKTRRYDSPPIKSKPGK